MNERIKELMQQATIRGEEYLPGNDGHPTPTVYFDKEKFAELLLQECVDACWRANKISYSVPPTQQQVALDCVREIETTFRS